MTPAQAIMDLRKRHGRQAIADAAGVTDGMVGHWSHGRHIPGVEHAVRIDELLGARGLVDAVRAARSRACKVCPRVFVTTERSSQNLYCSKACKKKAARDRSQVFRDSLSHRRAARLAGGLRAARASNARLRGAIDALCAVCPEGPVVCGNGECPAHLVTRHACVVEGCVIDHRRNAA